MGSNGVEENEDKKKRKYLTRSCLFIFFLSLLMSIAGGFVLGWWLHKYHPTNRQLWMVPFGFILFLTPFIIWLSLFIPERCNFKRDEEEAFDMPQPNDSVDNSLRDTKR